MSSSSEEAAVLKTIGYNYHQLVYQLDMSEYWLRDGLMDRIPKYVAIRNEERREYHRRNEIVMKKQLQECLQSVFKNHEEVSVVVLNKYNLADQVNALSLSALLIIGKPTNLENESCR